MNSPKRVIIAYDELGGVTRFDLGMELKSVQELAEDPNIRLAVGEQLTISCIGIHMRFQSYFVKTTRSQMTSLYQEAKVQARPLSKHMYVSVLRALNQWTDDEILMHYETKSPEWQRWCDDVILFYIYNLVLFEKAIPVVDLDE